MNNTGKVETIVAREKDVGPATKYEWQRNTVKRSVGELR